MATNITLTAGTLPQGYCFSSLQQYYNDIISLTLAQLPGTYSLFNYGSNVPDPADQDKPWIRTEADGTLEGLYTYNGVWCRPHPTPYGSNERRLWVGSEANLWAYDGGDGSDPTTSPPTDTTGAMWIVDTAFAFRFPVGVGTNGTTYDGNPASSVAVTGTGGAERHTLTETELPSHVHTILCKEDAAGGGTGRYLETALIPGDVTNNTGSIGGDVSHQNMPPYYGVYFIKRSARKYYTVS